MAMCSGVIILEGPDGAGKTTLAKQLMEHFPNSKHIHMTYRFKDQIFNYQVAALRLAERWVAKGHLVIIDRHWPSEAIYGRICRNGSKWPKMGRMMDRVLRKIGVVYIMCLPGTVDELVKNHSKLLQDEGRPEIFWQNYDEDQYRKIVQAYTDFWYGLGGCIKETYWNNDKMDYAEWLSIFDGGVCRDPNWLFYDWRKTKFSTLILHINAKLLFLKSSSKIVELIKRTRNFGGSPAGGQILMVGDKANPKTRGASWPFVDYGYSSLFISKELDKAGIAERFLAWVNIKDPHGETLAKSFAKTSSKVITLGHNADYTLKSSEATRIHHPSFARRFGIKNYSGQLRKAIYGRD